MSYPGNSFDTPLLQALFNVNRKLAGRSILLYKSLKKILLEYSILSVFLFLVSYYYSLKVCTSLKSS